MVDVNQPPRPRRSLVGTLGDLYRSRGLLLGLLATAIGIVLIVLSPTANPTIVTGSDGQLVVTEVSNLWTKLRIYDIGVAVFRTGLIISIFQVMLNQIADDRFIESKASGIPWDSCCGWLSGACGMRWRGGRGLRRGW